MSLRGMVGRKGSAVTFTLTQQDSYDESTDTSGVAVVTTVTGRAMRVAGDAQRYLALELRESEAPTLLFTPDAEDLPALNAAVTWGGIDYVVRDIVPLAMNGVATAARIIVSR